MSHLIIYMGRGIEPFSSTPIIIKKLIPHRQTLSV